MTQQMYHDIERATGLNGLTACPSSAEVAERCKLLDKPNDGTGQQNDDASVDSDATVEDGSDGSAGEADGASVVDEDAPECTSAAGPH